MIGIHLLRAMRFLLFGFEERPRIAVEAHTGSYLAAVEAALGPFSPRSAIVTNPMHCGKFIPWKFNLRETPWEELRPHLDFAFDACPHERLFPEIRVHTHEGRDVLLVFSQGYYGPTVVYEERPRRGLNHGNSAASM